MLAVESKNRSQHGRCFNSGSDPAASDMWEAPYIIQARQLSISAFGESAVLD